MKLLLLRVIIIKMKKNKGILVSIKDLKKMIQKLMIKKYI